MKLVLGIQTIALLGNYLPRKCGIATFTSDVLQSVAARYPHSQCFAVAVNDVEGSYEYPNEVRFEIEEQDLDSYRRAADFLNSSNVDVISLQHEFGIFGGPAGSHLLTLLQEVEASIVTTLHTVLENPNGDQRRVMEKLIERSTRLIVMTERGRALLETVYHTPPTKIDLIPHGIPDVSFTAPDQYKGQFGVSERNVLLTFGLLSPNKGIENVLEALPEIVAEFPDTTYIVLGATHPHELRTKGEQYRHGLEAIVNKHKLESNVIFHNRFVDLKELTEFIGAADLYITPYLDIAQITSGTLAYAFGAGKAVISTPYWHAAELLSDGRGILVPFANPEAIAVEAKGLLRDRQRRFAMSERAYKLGRSMVWSSTAGLYMHSFEMARQQAPAAIRPPRIASEWSLDHLYRMTTATGIFQHANIATPNHAEGYCTDDNARALVLTAMLSEYEEPAPPLLDIAHTYAAFLEMAYNPANGRFRNFMSTDGQWLDEHGSEDSHGRAMWALGAEVGRSRNWGTQIMADDLFKLALPAVRRFTSPRAWAFSLIGIHEYLRQHSGDRMAINVGEELTQRLVANFDQVSEPGWMWFEESLTYDNAKLAHALIISGSATKQWAVCDRGIKALSWLMGVQTSRRGYLRPIGSNGFYRRHGVRADFDQQPIEAQSTISACLAAYRHTSLDCWMEQAQIAFDWFLGWNDIGLPLYCPETGGCRDGLHSDRRNENRGAESTLAFLLSKAEMRQARAQRAGHNLVRLAAAGAQGLAATE